MGRIHRYEGDEVIVEFDLSRCIHTGDCTRDLPAVFDTGRRGRWVHPDGAKAADVARVCADCPTGALRCLRKSDGAPMDEAPDAATVQMAVDGPLYLHAQMILNGETLPGYRAAFCRCGASRLMPFCDESHREAGFHDAGRAAVPLAGEAGEGNQLVISWTTGGPLIVEGPFTLLDHDGAAVCQSSKAAFCRCGHSNMKPYCDGSHNRLDFETDAEGE